MTGSNGDDLFCYEKQLQQNHADTRLDIVAQADSTQNQVNPDSVLIADSQQSGVGRRGNHWLSPAGQAISLSYRFTLPLPARALSGYQLTAALAVTACLRHFGCREKRLLKWPNDLVFNRRKFGGILINLCPGQNQSTDVIVGIGLNWRLNDAALKQVDQAICNVPLNKKPDRGLFIDRLLSTLKLNNQRFCEHGLAPFLAQWSDQDSLHNGHIELHQDGSCVRGLYAGLSPAGELQIRRQGEICRFDSGEVSVRPL